MLDQTDVVFVAGGNTFFLLQEMRKGGFAELIHDYIHKGMIYIGSSAGSVVAGPTVRLVNGLDDPTDAPELQDFAGLGLIDIAILPHWGSPKRCAQAAQSYSP
jgi:dipeptidase E